MMPAPSSMDQSMGGEGYQQQAHHHQMHPYYQQQASQPSQQQGYASRGQRGASAAGPFQTNAGMLGFGANETAQLGAAQDFRRFGGAPLTPGTNGMSALEQVHMMGSHQHMGYRQSMSTDLSPGLAAGNYNMEMSPTIAQRMTFRSGSMYHGVPMTSPNMAVEMDNASHGRASVQMPGGGMAVAGSMQPDDVRDREEELLLQLLIARRQRSRMVSEGKAAGGRQTQAFLADELVRLRQSRGSMSQPQQGRGEAATGLPPLPGMPPLFSDPGGSYHPVSHPNPGLYPTAADFRTSDTAMNFAAMNMQADLSERMGLSERIDRSPGRIFDARSQEMLDASMRGIKRNMAAMDKLPLPLMDSAMTGLPVVKKPRRQHKKKPSDMPRRPLSAYNLFFSEERERILREIESKRGGDSSKDDKDEQEMEDEGEQADDKQEADEQKDEEDSASKPKALLRPLIPADKKRRPHRKTHGKISFQELARMVGERWKSLPEEGRRYYQDLAQQDMKRQKAAMEEYYAKQNEKKLKPGSDESEPADVTMADDGESGDVSSAQPLAAASRGTVVVAQPEN